MANYEYIDEGVFTVGDFLSREECESLVALAEFHGFSDAPINSTFGPVLRPDMRNNRRLIWDDHPLAARLWPRAAEYVGGVKHGRRAIGLNERFRFYRYDRGQQFDWHIDGCFERTNGERSLVTVLCYLNEGFEGGATSFHDNDVANGRQIDVVPRTAMALFFDHHLIHKGQPVTAGTKYVLRTDVMYSSTR